MITRKQLVKTLSCRNANTFAALPVDAACPFQQGESIGAHPILCPPRRTVNSPRSNIRIAQNASFKRCNIATGRRVCFSRVVVDCDSLDGRLLGDRPSRSSRNQGRDLEVGPRRQLHTGQACSGCCIRVCSVELLVSGVDLDIGR